VATGSGGGGEGGRTVPDVSICGCDEDCCYGSGGSSSRRVADTRVYNTSRWTLRVMITSLEFPGLTF